MACSSSGSYALKKRPTRPENKGIREGTDIRPAYFPQRSWPKTVTSTATDNHTASNSPSVHGAAAGRCATCYDSEARRIDPMVTWRAWGIPVRCGAGMVVLQTLLALYRFGDSTALLQLVNPQLWIGLGLFFVTGWIPYLLLVGIPRLIGVVWTRYGS